MATLLKDDTGVPIPQYMTESGTGFEGMTGTNGAINVKSPSLLASIEALKATVDSLNTTVDNLLPLVESIKTVAETIVTNTALLEAIKTACETTATNTTPTQT